jgi:enoyl-CoA hydratase/3-hydroxyacyl-CoA dehydrogenase
MNALTAEITDEILAVLETGANDPTVNGFVITGYGTVAFSAGADIGNFPKYLGNFDALYDYTKEWTRMLVHLDQMKKPTVAAVNGMALGGGLELAIRCHGIVATKNAMFQFPEITLGILPGIGGAIVPYRKWPQGAAIFNKMLTQGTPLFVDRAVEIGMVSQLVEDHSTLVSAAIDEVARLRGNIVSIPDGRFDPGKIEVPDQNEILKMSLSKEAISITVQTIQNGCAASTFEDALEIGYKGFSEIGCTDAAKEGISAFIDNRKPQFKK